MVSTLFLVHLKQTAQGHVRLEKVEAVQQSSLRLMKLDDVVPAANVCLQLKSAQAATGLASNAHMGLHRSCDCSKLRANMSAQQDLPSLAA